ncbi:MAG TPA: nuclear transport factor 2 family protein [Oculatellaceae cyanobacterium]
MKRQSKVAVISLLSQLAFLGSTQAFADENSKNTAPSSAPAAGNTPAPAVTTSSAAAKDSAPETKAVEEPEVKIPKNLAHSSSKLSNTNCKIKCLDPHAPTEEAAEVIDVLQKMYIAYADKDLSFFEHHLAQDCTTFYEGDQKVILGKKAALEDIKEWTDKEAKVTDAPLMEIVLEHPYCNVNEGHAVITFTAFKEIGGTHPGKFKSHVNDVFKRNGGTWELLTHFRSNWKEVK